MNARRPTTPIPVAATPPAPARPRRAPERRHAAGFTLIELSISLVIFAIVMLACQSAILLAARGIPDGRGVGSSVLLNTATMDTLSSELAYATQILSATATDVSFVIPDRDGDGNPETVRYTWGGKAGDPLIKTYNGRQITVAPRVQEFALAYDRRTVQAPQTSSEGPEILLASNDGSLFLGSQSTDASHWWGQYFIPSVSGSATGWRVTRVLLALRSNGTRDGQLLVQIRPASGNVPASSILDQATVYESSLSTGFSWQQISFNSSYQIPPSTGACIVLAQTGSGTSCDVRYLALDLTSGKQVMLGSSSSGSSWSTYGLNNLLFYAYGRVTTPDPVVYYAFLTNVRCTLRTSTDTAARLVTTARCLNEPQVAGN